MLRSLIVIGLLFALVLGVSAQNASTNRVSVIVESAIIRALPAEDAPMAASVFKDQVLETVGRSLDGRWLQVQRPGRLTTLGWIFDEMVEFPEGFRPERLPLTDLATGLLGPTPLQADPGFAAYVNEGAVLRDQPFGEGNRIIGVPFGVIVAVLERDSQSQWLHINYLGYEGWIAAFTVRRVPNLAAVPVSPLRSAKQIEILVIPPEIQLAQLQRMRDYINPQLEMAINLEFFWTQVVRGEIQPCTPPGFSLDFTYSRQDLRELPEIGRYAPRINNATTYINDSIAAFQQCGVLSPKEALTAQANAINARIIYREALVAIANTEALIR
jgi:hypothetical protein